MTSSMTSSIPRAVANARVSTRASHSWKPTRPLARPKSKRVVFPRSVAVFAAAEAAEEENSEETEEATEVEIVAVSAEELEAALMAEAEAAAAAAADGVQTASDSAMTAFAEAKARAHAELKAESNVAVDVAVESKHELVMGDTPPAELVMGDDESGDGNAPPKTKTLTGNERRAKAAQKAEDHSTITFTEDHSNNVLPTDPDADEVVELTATVRALKLRMSSLAKLLDEAVARRQNLETELATEKEKGAATVSELTKAKEMFSKQLNETNAEVAVLKEQLDETRENLVSTGSELETLQAEMVDLRQETEDLHASTEVAKKEAGKRLKEATAVRFELQATREILIETEAAKTEVEQSLIAVAAETEKRLEARLKAGVDEAAAALASNARRDADETARKAAALLASATELEAKAREALAKDASAASAAALTKAEKEIEAALEARDLALEAAAATQQRLQNQTVLLRQVDAMTNETSSFVIQVAEQAETIDALNKEVEALRENAAESAADAARGLSMAEAAENKIADRVSQTLQAAETCVSTAEKVKKEVERNALAAEGVAAQQLEAATARANAAEENLRRSNERLDEMTAIAGKKEAMDMKNESQARELEQKSRLIKDLIDETERAKDTIAHWEDKATVALVELETKNRELSEATENATSLKVQIASAMARATHAEESLRSQTQLLDEMAEIAALKESAQALVVTLQQELEAKEGEVVLLAESAKKAQESAATWQAKAAAAVSSVEKRASAAEAAAAAIKQVAEQKLKVLEENEGALYAAAEEQAVETAVRLKVEAVEAEAEHKVYAATANAESLRRALAASNQGAELWREKAEQAAAELEALTASDDLESRISDMKGKGGRLTAHAFSRGEDLRSFIVKGSPRLEDESSENPQVVELESVGLGAPFHGRYDLIDAPDRRRQLTREEAKAMAKAAKAALPTPRWSIEEEANNKERLPFNPRARGVVGKKAEKESATPSKKGASSPR